MSSSDICWGYVESASPRPRPRCRTRPSSAITGATSPSWTAVVSRRRLASVTTRTGEHMIVYWLDPAAAEYGRGLGHLAAGSERGPESGLFSFVLTDGTSLISPDKR